MLKPLHTHMTADYRPLNNANVQPGICYSVQILLEVIDINSELLQAFVRDVAACVHGEECRLLPLREVESNTWISSVKRGMAKFMWKARHFNFSA